MNEGGHSIHIMSASRLTNELRQAVQSLAPDLILLELSHAIDNPHLYFFLRSDRVTRNTPIILVSAGRRLAHQAEIFDADGYLQRPFAAEQFHNVVASHLPSRHRAVAAA
ncbi:MAG: hypothetical protein IPO81_03215 [Kouleothrix sp.]|nr:hypothetical protein [Kouleothrix sp.]